ncbi:hypothetical protein LNP25_28050 [Klebsiella variicola subsp. variicola]|nr:hypothetical protein [Klebsiella variicola subsp. variicola]
MLLQQRLLKAIILVTHDINEAIRLGDKIAIFRKAACWRSLIHRPYSWPTRRASSCAALYGRPNLKRLGHDTGRPAAASRCPLLDGSADTDRRYPSTAGQPLRLVLDRQRRPLHWFDPQRGLTLPVERPLASSHSLRFAYSALLDVATGVLVHVDDEGQYQGRYPHPAAAGARRRGGGAISPIDWSWVIDNRAMIGDLLWQHARMVLLALLFGSLLTGGLLAVTLRWPATAQPLITLCGVLFTIPSLALFILLLPFTGLSLTHLADWPDAVLLLILLRNVLAGMEAAAGSAGVRAGARLHPRVPLLRYRAVAAAALSVYRAAHCLGDAGRPGHVTALIGQGGLGQLLLAGLIAGLSDADCR